MTPNDSSQKVERIEARVSREQKSLFQRAAELTGVSLTDFTINALLERAHRIIQESEIMNLSMRDQHAFVDALLRPPTPSAKLLKLQKNRISSKK